VILSISMVVLLGIAVFFLWKTGYQRIGPAVVVGLFGFFLAGTGLAPMVNAAVSSVAGWISSL